MKNQSKIIRSPTDILTEDRKIIDMESNLLLNLEIIRNYLYNSSDLEEEADQETGKRTLKFRYTRNQENVSKHFFQ